MAFTQIRIQWQNQYLYIISFVLHFLFPIQHMVGKTVSQPQMRTLPSLSSYLTIISRVLLQLINTTHIHHRKFIKIRSLKQKAKKSEISVSTNHYIVFTSSLFVFCPFHILIDHLLTHFSDYIIFCHMNVPQLFLTTLLTYRVWFSKFIPYIVS